MTCATCNGTGKVTIRQASTLSVLDIQCTNCIPGVRYAGIGSRKTPEPILLEMQNIAMMLALRQFVLCSGCSQGADKAFEAGCDAVRGVKILRSITHHAPALEHASQFHPAWDRCSETAQGLHARNSQILLGDTLDKPVKFVICWTADGAVTGGTGQALRIAAAYSIPVFNLATVPSAAFWSWLDAQV